MFWWIVGAVLLVGSYIGMQPFPSDPGYTMNCGQQVYY